MVNKGLFEDTQKIMYFLSHGVRPDYSEMREAEKWRRIVANADALRGSKYILQLSKRVFRENCLLRSGNPWKSRLAGAMLGNMERVEEEGLIHPFQIEERLERSIRKIPGKLKQWVIGGYFLNTIHNQLLLYNPSDIFEGKDPRDSYGFMPNLP